MKTARTLIFGSIAVSAGLAASLAMAQGNQPGATDKEFSMMDSNKDGKISTAEHEAGARSMFEKMDSNKDGKVTAAEMTSAHYAVTGRHATKSDMSAADKIKAVDSNGDGILTADEHATASATMFAKMDTDHDGLLSKNEMAAGHANMMKKPSK